jgi:hypothetical protein
VSSAVVAPPLLGVSARLQLIRLSGPIDCLSQVAGFRRVDASHENRPKLPSWQYFVDVDKGEFRKPRVSCLQWSTTISANCEGMRYHLLGCSDILT